MAQKKNIELKIFHLIKNQNYSASCQFHPPAYYKGSVIEIKEKAIATLELESSSQEKFKTVTKVLQTTKATYDMKGSIVLEIEMRQK